MEQLKILMRRQDVNSHVKNVELQKVQGKCLRCGGLASTILKYRVQGVIAIERYCDECLKSVPSIKSKKHVRA